MLHARIRTDVAWARAGPAAIDGGFIAIEDLVRAVRRSTDVPPRRLQKLRTVICDADGTAGALRIGITVAFAQRARSRHIVAIVRGAVLAARLRQRLLQGVDLIQEWIVKAARSARYCEQPNRKTAEPSTHHASLSLNADERYHVRSC
jgi:hypothetical protein